MLSLLSVQVLFLVEELRSCKPPGAANHLKKEKGDRYRHGVEEGGLSDIE